MPLFQWHHSVVIANFNKHFLKFMIKNIILLALMVCSMVEVLAQPMLNSIPGKSKYKQSLGVVAKVSTTGIGGDIYWMPMKKWAFRAGYDSFGLKYNFSIDQQSIALDAHTKIRTGSISVGAGYQILNWLYATAAIGYLDFKPQGQATALDGVSFGDIIIDPETAGSLSFAISPRSSIRPYLGIGFGRYAPRRGVSFGFEIGAWYMGPPKLDVQATGMLAPTADADHVAMLERQISVFQFYPVIKFNLAVKIVTL